jgi:hypothetical protein
VLLFICWILYIQKRIHIFSRGGFLSLSYENHNERQSCCFHVAFQLLSFIHTEKGYTLSVMVFSRRRHSSSKRIWQYKIMLSTRPLGLSCIRSTADSTIVLTLFRTCFLEVQRQNVKCCFSAVRFCTYQKRSWIDLWTFPACRIHHLKFKNANDTLSARLLVGAT